MQQKEIANGKKFVIQKEAKLYIPSEPERRKKAFNTFLEQL